MKTSLSFPLFLVCLISPFIGSASGCQTCDDVCPWVYDYVGDADECARISSYCGDAPEYHGGPGKVLTCKGWCSTDIFGCNADTCGDCPAGRRLRGLGAIERDECSDHELYAPMTAQEKLNHLGPAICGREGLVAKPTIAAALGAVADSDGDGHISCEEFNSAYGDFDVNDVCE